MITAKRTAPHEDAPTRGGDRARACQELANTIAKGKMWAGEVHSVKHEGLESPIRDRSADLGRIPAPLLERLARDSDVVYRYMSPDAVPKRLIRALEDSALPVTERGRESARVVQGHDAPVCAANRDQGQREGRDRVEIRVAEYARYERRVPDVADGSVTYNLNGLPKDVIGEIGVIVDGA